MQGIANYFSGTDGGAGDVLFGGTELGPDFRLGRDRARLAGAVFKVTEITQAGHWPPRVVLECQAPQVGHRIWGLIVARLGASAAPSTAPRLEIDPCTLYSRNRRAEIAGNRKKSSFGSHSSFPIFLALSLAPALIRTGMNTSKACFDHEKLVAFQRSIQFIAWANQALQNVPRKLAVHDQLDRASTSVPLNIAEGNAKYTAPDRCRYFDTARGSALECAACLEVLVAKGEFTPDQVRDGKALLHQMVSLLVGLIRSISPDRLGEESVPYRPARES